MANRLTYEKHSRPINATAAGTTVINGAATDMQDFDGCVFVCSMGALTATQVTSLKAQQSLDGSTNWTDIAGAVTANAADTDSNKLLVLDVYRPQQRFIRAVVNRATANAVIDSVVAHQYAPKKAPTTQDATVSQSLAQVGS